ncbi:septation protein SepH [Agrococcus terreus]|uniref:DUF3071 domain-containing protein n=1 Tax=Agrococcus terreus TaxID=574649 RepID=A0ABQ2KH59_9MICO|nr:septation protein SepH [Agrococcus terreus]GGN83230.1 hypothetical protein GCM10010968_13790 [Agrococcus terreus]
MQQLTVVGVEDEVLILESESGERFSVPVEALPERRTRPSAIPARERKTSPRDVQALIRGGMSAQEVAASTGEELAYVQRFEGPVLAERAHMLESALSIPVASGDIDPLAGETTFGAALEERLDDLRASDRSWAAWKDAEGGAWTVRLRFTTEAIQHEATWAYEPKKASLVARGKEATSLSQAGDASSVLVPRLRAIDRQSRPADPAPVPAARTSAPAPETDAPPIAQRAREVRETGPVATAGPSGRVDAARTDTGRFDSDAFRIERGTARSAPAPVEPGVGLEDAVAASAASPAAPEATRADNPWLRRRTGEVGTQPEGVQAAAINRSAGSAQPNHTAELLDALRRRRSEREAALRTAEDEPQREPEPQPVQEERAQRAGATGPVGARKRGSRAAMPSWDEIVFGSRADDDR